MQFQNEELDELLSGYLDDQLNAAELLAVRSALEGDPSVRDRLEELRRTTSEVKRSSAAVGTQQLSRNFAQSVVAEAQRRAIESGLPDSHHVRRGDRSNQNQVPQKPSWRVPATILGTIATLAAMFLVFISLPDRVEDPAVEPEVPVGRYVSDIEQITYMMIVDLELSQESYTSGYLAKIFGESGISLEDPIVANEAAQAELSKVQMIVQPKDSEEAGDALIYFVHADTASLGEVLEAVYGDTENVTKLRFGLAFDNPLNSFMYRIAKSSGKRFAMNVPIAVPLTVDASARVSPFSGIGAQGKLISSGNRLKPDAAANFTFMDAGESTVLFLIRVPK